MPLRVLSGTTHVHQMACAMMSTASAIKRISSLPERQAAMSHRHDRYWQAIMVPIRQLSHCVLPMCISSWSIHRVLATLWVKQKKTCAATRLEGRRTAGPCKIGHLVATNFSLRICSISRPCGI